MRTSRALRLRSLWAFAPVASTKRIDRVPKADLATEFLSKLLVADESRLIELQHIHPDLDEIGDELCNRAAAVENEVHTPMVGSLNDAPKPCL